MSVHLHEIKNIKKLVCDEPQALNKLPGLHWAFDGNEATSLEGIC